MSKTKKATAPAAAPQEGEVIVMMKRSRLRESPFNPRKTYNYAALVELAETMKPPTGRIHSPLVVRPISRAGEQTDIEADHEIVFGHRRNRAAGIAELEVVPVIVRDMTDEEARIAQLIENAQREDVSAIEEADSLLELHRRHGLTIADLMQRTGKSRRYVFNQLALARAHDEVREAVQTKLIGAEVGRLLAALPIPLQPKALDECLVSDMETTSVGGKPVKKARSTRQVEEILRARYRLKLDEAPFDTLSIRLVPDTLACDACPKRSDNEPALVEQMGAGVCTDPDCFAAKCAAHRANELQKARKAGHSVIEAEEAEDLLVSASDNAPTGFIPLTDHTGRLSLAGVELTYADALEALRQKGGQVPHIVTIVHPHRPGVVLHCLDEEYADTVLAAVGAESKPSEGEHVPKRLQEQRARDEEAARREAEEDARRTPQERAVHENWLAIKRAVMRRTLTTPRALEDLRAWALGELDMCGDFGMAEEVLGWQIPEDCEDPQAWRVAEVHRMTPDQLGALLVMVAIDNGGFANFGDHRAARLALCERYGVDPLNPDAAPKEAAPTPPTAARARKMAAEVLRAFPAKKAAARYRNEATGETWSGRGLQPAWLKNALAAGARLADFDTQQAALPLEEEEQTVDAGVTAGGSDATAEATEGAEA